MGVLRICDIEWLTPIDTLLTAENKPVQEAAAHHLQIPYPTTAITSDPDVARSFGDDVVVKPVSTNRYFDGVEFRAVFANMLPTESHVLDALVKAPFLCQEALRAERHFRVVTVCDRAWVAALDAHDLPLDWREQDEAHSSFVEDLGEDELATSALAMARVLGLRFSSQDWLRTDRTTYLLDVNPAGQWLFLPESIGSAVAQAIADWLESGL
jgi:glutathione synthase/RimK-type ligase-like ATP-grasp enzyme